MAARDYLNGTKLDDRIIRVDMDPGFEPDRQYGRGTSGGQVRDDRRQEYDEGRGGLPPRRRREMERHAVASGTLVGPTSGPLDRNHRQQRHRYEMNMEANPHLKHQPDRRQMERDRPGPPRENAAGSAAKSEDSSKVDGVKENLPKNEEKKDSAMPEVGQGDGVENVNGTEMVNETALKSEEEIITKKETEHDEDLSEPPAKRQKLE